MSVFTTERRHSYVNLHDLTCFIQEHDKMNPKRKKGVCIVMVILHPCQKFGCATTRFPKLVWTPYMRDKEPYSSMEPLSKRNNKVTQKKGVCEILIFLKQDLMTVYVLRI